MQAWQWISPNKSIVLKGDKNKVTSYYLYCDKAFPVSTCAHTNKELIYYTKAVGKTGFQLRSLQS